MKPYEKIYRAGIYAGLLINDRYGWIVAEDRNATLRTFDDEGAALYWLDRQFRRNHPELVEQVAA